MGWRMDMGMAGITPASHCSTLGLSLRFSPEQANSQQGGISPLWASAAFKEPPEE